MIPIEAVADVRMAVRSMAFFMTEMEIEVVESYEA